MLKKILFLMVLLAFAVSLALPVGPVAAGGARRVDFTATSENLCEKTNFEGDDFCDPGEIIFMPNGRFYVVGYKTVMVFTASDPRWNADCDFTADPFSPVKPHAFPLMGSFVCYPRDERFEGGWWEGNVREVFMADKFMATWNGKGYGSLAELHVISYNTMSSKYDIDVPVPVTDVGTILELPGYVPPD